MKRKDLSRDGFILRIVECGKCGDKIIHPVDEQEYMKFRELKKKQFNVKMRLVGNSYAVSIPKEIVSFMNEMDQQMHNHSKMVDNMVKLCFEDMGRVSLNFRELGDEE